MTATATCVGFHVDCAILAKGGLAVVMAFTVFIGSVYLLLAAVFGRRMGYLVLAVAFFSWMILFSSLWTFGFFSQGPTTPVDLGPRGAEPGWLPIAAGFTPPARYPEYTDYPNGPEWKTPGTNVVVAASVQSATGAMQAFLANQANAKLGKATGEPGALSTSDFTVQNLKFATHGKVSLVAAQAFYNGGGPVVNVYAYHNSGSVIRYSWMFLIGSILGFAIHVPFLDRAERKRKEILTGGTAPPWYGPA